MQSVEWDIDHLLSAQLCGEILDVDSLDGDVDSETADSYDLGVLCGSLGWAL